MTSAKLSAFPALFLCDQFSDVVIKVVNRKDGYTWSYPVHSLVVSAGSEVLKERIDFIPEGEQKLLTFVDLDPKIVLLVLRFLYFGDLPPIRSEENLLQLMGVAHKWRIRPLQEECQKKILRCIRIGNACRLLEIATSQIALGYGNTTIVEACKRVVLDYGHLIFSSDHVLDLSRANLNEVLQTDKLNVLDETVVFDGLWRWGKMTCCKAGGELTVECITDCLGDLLGHIRYSSMASINMVPPPVKDRFISRKPSCCFADNGGSKLKNRCPFRQPSDLLSHCTLIDMDMAVSRSISDDTNITSSHVRTQCAQISFDTDLYLCALAIEANHCGDELTDADTFVLTIRAENTGLEIIREKVYWEDVSSNGGSCAETEERALVSTVRLSVPICVKRGLIHSVYLTRQTGTTVAANCSKWSFKARQIGRRTIPIDPFFNATVHCDRLVSLYSLYVIPFVNMTS